MIIFGRPFIRAMHAWQKKGQPISENVPQSHRAKAGTPTMGGILLVLAILISSVLFMPMSNPTGWIALLALSMFSILGFVDDYKKVSSQSVKASNGLKPSTRLLPGKRMAGSLPSAASAPFCRLPRGKSSRVDGMSI